MNGKVRNVFHDRKADALDHFKIVETINDRGHDLAMEQQERGRGKMKAMVLNRLCQLHGNPTPLDPMDVPVPVPGELEILVKVSACGVCHTELDEIEGRTPPPHLPVIPGHQVIGYVEETGDKANRFKPEDRVGIAWIYSACGECKFCRSGRERRSKALPTSAGRTSGNF